MIRAILIDDEKNALEVLEWQLQTFCPQVSIVAMYQNAAAGINGIREHQPDLVFLDVEMPVHNGFDVVQAFPEPSFHVIFTTAYDKFAVKAIRFAALDFLLKPIDTAELKDAVERCEKKAKPEKAQLDKLQQAVGRSAAKVSLPTQEGIVFADPDQVIRCESSSNYTRIYFSDNKQLLISKTLKEVEELFRHASFYRPHHSHLINLNYVGRYLKADGGAIEMTDGSLIAISRQKKDGFLSVMLKREDE